MIGYLVSREIAIEAKELGCNIESYAYYNKGSDILRYINLEEDEPHCNEFDDVIAVQEQTKLQEWLHKKFMIIVEPRYNYEYNYFDGYVFDLHIHCHGNPIIQKAYGTREEAFNEALYVAIQKAKLHKK